LENNITIIKSYNIDETAKVVLEAIINQVIVCDDNRCYFREDSV
jgi:aspartate carbamoyltransferase regulatory subunit